MYDVNNTPELCPIRHTTHKKSNVTNTWKIFIWKCCVKNKKQKAIKAQYVQKNE
jgi:hypothetical protein